MDDIEILESAYIELFDYREFDTSDLSTSTVKSVLGGLSNLTRSENLAESKLLKIQFNPNSLKFTSGAPNKEGSQKEKKSIVYDDGKGPASFQMPEKFKNLSMSFSVVFDRSRFPLDNSVQPEVEGFLAVMKNPYLRQVAFHWGKIYYKGRLTKLDAHYKMFTKIGIPTRAVLDIAMEIL